MGIRGSADGTSGPGVKYTLDSDRWKGAAFGQFDDLSNLVSAAGIESTNVDNSDQQWPDKTFLRCLADPPGVIRIWNRTAKHARLVMFPGGATTTLDATSSAIVAVTSVPTGAPSGGSGTLAYMQSTQTVYKYTSAWDGGTPLSGASTGGVVQLMSNASAVGPGQAFDSPGQVCSFEFSGTGATGITARIESSDDGTTWTALGPNLNVLATGQVYPSAAVINKKRKVRANLLTNPGGGLLNVWVKG